MSTTILLVFRIGIANIQPIFPKLQTKFTFILHKSPNSLLYR